MGEIEKFCFRPSSSFSIAMTARLKQNNQSTFFFFYFSASRKFAAKLTVFRCSNFAANLTVFCCGKFAANLTVFCCSKFSANLTELNNGQFNDINSYT